MAERWCSGRVFLAGDAAHLTPPFAGQGMNSGVRDAANLAWKLAAVVKRQMAATLLESYETERKPHAWSLIRMAVRIGAFMQPKSVAGAMLAQGALKMLSVFPPVRDYVMQLKFKPKPRFFSGVFFTGEADAARVPAGQLMPQPAVELPGGSRVMLDEVLGHDFALLALDGFPAIDVLRCFEAAGMPCRHVALVAQRDDFLPATLAAGMPRMVRDQAGILEPIIRSADAQAVLLRPDGYVFGYLGPHRKGMEGMQALLARYACRSAPAAPAFRHHAA